MFRMKILDIDNNFNLVEIHEVTDGRKYWIWCYVDELEDIKTRFSIRKDNVEDCKEFNKSTKIEYYEEYIFVVFNILEYYDEGVHSRELYIFLNNNFIITSFKEDLDLLNNLLMDISSYKNCSMLKEDPSTTILFYYIIDRIIVKNYNVISIIEEEGDKIELRILKNPKHELLVQLIHLRRQLYKLRKYLNPLRYIGDTLQNDNSIIEKKYIKHFQGLNNKIDKLMLSLDSLYGDIALVREAYEAEIANKTNDLMKIFTIIATIFLPLNLITSIYGMNVKKIPFSEHEYGYYLVVIFMVLTSVLLIRFFKNKNWF